MNNLEYHVAFRATTLPSRQPWSKAGHESAEASLGFSLSSELSSCCREFAGQLKIEQHLVLEAGLRALVLRYEGRLGDAPSWTFRKLLERSGSVAEGVFEVGFECGTTLQADLALSLTDSVEGCISGLWRFRSDLFDSDAVVRLDRHYCRLLAALLADPDAPITEACFLTEAEREQSITTWNNTQLDYPRNSTIPELFEQVVAGNAERIAVIDGADRLTYGQLNERANRLALYLAEQGVPTGARVGIALERSQSMVVSMLAILKAGCLYVPLDSGYPAERLRFIIADTDLSAIVTDQAGAEKLPGGARTIRMEDAVQRELAAGFDGQPGVTAESTAYIMYTSGSTGTPKGVEVTHRGIIRLVRASYVDFGPEEIFAQIANCCFDAITFEVWGALLNGARLVILPTAVVLSPETFAAAIQEQRITAMFLTSSLFNLVAARCPHAFHTVRHLLAGGDAVDPGWARHILENAPPGRLINGYGPTECTTFSVTHDILEVPPGAATVPIGRPLSNSQAYVLDWQMQPAPVGVPGELYLGGDGLAKGYWKRPEITAERFVPSPFDPTGQARLYKTGDLARYREDGVIECLGRTDHQVKIRGFRIELGEIETALRTHPRVIDCAVVVSEDASGSKSLAAYLATGKASKPAPEEFRQFLRDRLPDYMLPSKFLCVDELPLSPNGKVDRKRLPRFDSVLTLEVRIGPSPANETQRTIAEAWKKVLGVSIVGVDDNFFDLGGNSLQVAAVECELKSAIETSFTITDLFEHPTIRSLAARLSNAKTETSFARDAQQRAQRRRAAVSGLRAIGRGA